MRKLITSQNKPASKQYIAYPGSSASCESNVSMENYF